jgi:hypothetical protein
MTDPDVLAIVARLAAAQLADWPGLPSGWRAVSVDDALDVVLGSDRVDADLVLLDDPADGCSARAWLRNGEVVLLEVAWRTTAPAWPVDGLESPETRDDVVDGLVVVPSGEWVYPQRGLSVVTNQDGTSARHLFGFVPTTLDVYRRLLRPDLATVRRPAARMTGGDEL